MAESNHSVPHHSAAAQATAPAQPRASSPLSWEGDSKLRLLPWCGKINLRGEAHNPQFLEAARAALGASGASGADISLPQPVNRTANGDATLIFCLGPNEWLLHCELERTETLLENLRKHLAPLHHAATEVTDYYSVLEVQGEHAIAALARGCPLDLHERVFKPQQCAQSRFGNASVLLYKPAAAPRFHMQVRWSFTEYVWDYLVSALDGLPLRMDVG